MSNIYTRGSGTEDDPYLVSNLEQLDAIRHNLDKHFIQIADLDLEDREWQPIGEVYADDTSDKPFNGSYDGNGYFIKNVKVDKPLQISVGLFSFVGENGNIKNVEVNNYILRGNDGVGAIIGLNNGVISSSHVFEGKTKGNKYTGGIVGINNGEIVNCCTQEETLVDGEKISGGLVGLNEGEIKNSYSIAEVINNELAGGLFGDDNGEVVASYYDQEKSNITLPVAKEEKTTQDLSDNDLYEDWNFDDKWEMYKSFDGIKYPKLNISKQTYAEFAGGKGTKEDPYLISHPHHFNNIRNDLESHYKQISDIKLDNYWEPVGSFNLDSDNNKVFKGTYDGSNYDIREVRIDANNENGKAIFANIGDNSILKDMNVHEVIIKNSNNSSELAGLVAYNAGNIKNCSIEVVEIYGDKCVGGLVAYNEGKINNCQTMDTSLSGYVSGGLVGYNNYGKINNCSAQSAVIDGNICGGLVGMSEKGSIFSSYAFGEVSGSEKMGGLIGQNSSQVEESFSETSVLGSKEIGGLIGINDGVILNSISEGYVGLNLMPMYAEKIINEGTEAQNPIGGFIGLNSGEIINSYSVAEINSSIDYGGFVDMNAGGKIENCFFDKDKADIIKFEDAIAKSSEDLKKKETYTNWDFENIWEFRGESFYPSFQIK